MIFRKHQGSGASSDSSLIDLMWWFFSPPDDSWYLTRSSPGFIPEGPRAPGGSGMLILLHT